MVHNILASFSDVTNPPVQYSQTKKIDYTDFDVVPMRETARCHKILGPPLEWGPMGPHIINIMGPPSGFWGPL